MNNNIHAHGIHLIKHQIRISYLTHSNNRHVARIDNMRIRWFCMVARARKERGRERVNKNCKPIRGNMVISNRKKMPNHPNMMYVIFFFKWPHKKNISLRKSGRRSRSPIPQPPSGTPILFSSKRKNPHSK